MSEFWLNKMENDHGFIFPVEDREFLKNTYKNPISLKINGNGWYWDVFQNKVVVSKDDTGNEILMVFLKYHKYYLNDISGTYIGLKCKPLLSKAMVNQRNASQILDDIQKR